MSLKENDIIIIDGMPCIKLNEDLPTIKSHSCTTRDTYKGLKARGYHFDKRDGCWKKEV